MIISLYSNVNAQTDSTLTNPETEIFINDSNLTNPQDSLNNKIDSTNSATGFSGGEKDKVLTLFNYSTIELKQGEIISNVLKVYNKSDDSLKFSLDILAPGSWHLLTNKDEIYNVASSDTIFIPIILIPNKLINGNTEVIINTFLLDKDDNQIGNNYFTLTTLKKTSWNISVEPSNRMYFKNDEKTIDFKYKIENTGNYKQDIFVDYQTLRGDLMLLDSNENYIDDPKLTLNLDSYNDTTLDYTVSTVNDRERNFRKVSINNYRPGTNQYFKKYSLYINSSEPKSIGEGSFQKGNKVDFIRLPNETKMQDYGYPYLPLTVEATAQNLLGGNSFMSLNMRGYKQLNKDASIAYFTQINYTQDYYDNNFITNSPWYIGYFDRNKTVEIGQVSGNVIGINGYGKGIKASYSYLEKQKTGAFFVRSPGLFSNTRTESYGLFHTYRHNEYFAVTGKFGRQINFLNGSNINSYSLLPKFNINRKHYFNFIGAFTRRSDSPTININPVNGFLVGGNYASRFIDNKLKVNLNGRYNDKNFSSGVYRRFAANHRSGYDLNKKWNVYLSNNYQNTKTYSILSNNALFRQEYIFNNLVFSTLSKGGSYQPGIYYDYRDYLSNKVHSRGLSFRYSTYNFNRNFLASFFTRAGYSLPVDIEPRKDYFNLQMSSILRYRAWNFTGRYNYGAYANTYLQTQVFNRVTPQNVRLSLQNQHQFKNKHLILQSSMIYSYGNVYKNHSIGLFPEVFLFTNSGWRFSINANYTINSSDYGSLYNDNYLTGVDFGETERQYNDNITLGASIKKNLGIPIPFIKKQSATLEFVSFYDINGNGVQDKDEPGIENVVIRLGPKEVISNKKGGSSVKNIPMDNYFFNVFALDEESGWFPNVEDSINVMVTNGVYYVPFVRGVKVYGDIVLERQKIAITDTSKIFDLSRIKITATNGKTYNTLTDINGKYEFYMPNGEYVITMDESILENKYKLSRNNIPVTLKSSQDGVYVSFYIVENKKKVVIKEFNNTDAPE